MRQDDRGITLIEMIIAVAVSVIVIGAATLFIRNALRSYGHAANMIDLQIEAQVLMEQLATWVMEGNYVDKVKDDEGNDVFVIYHIPREIPDEVTLPAGRKESEYMGERWMRAFKCDENVGLCMYKAEESAPDPGSSLIWIDDEESLLSKYVEGFTVTIYKDSEEIESSDEAEDSGESYKVAVTLSMKAGIQKYEFKDEIKMRNTTYAPATGSDEPDTP